MSSLNDVFIDNVLKLFKKKNIISHEIDSVQERSPLDEIDNFYIDEIINHISNISGLLKTHTNISIEILKLLNYDMSLFELFQQLSESIMVENYNACSMLKKEIVSKVSTINL
jgi:hypothetical protein